ncbi:hypothetical protein Acsp03_52520 [Actinomadura sp. NBRC 104412]|uniref:biotin carboxylase N-terminal domain-containing protein n=1 Tax=Actinomadura sp. NBRC 104412 TaxID=3032203 RepID=UPI0024A56ECB|nr:biotin carboxylase N-terminal domain-containing protein [Actinomadura sp. NBRC 104412]GLZ07786.1 hypothetical protein Acsp03_52520 [Actinomadura sp. NBRC 104412]
MSLRRLLVANRGEIAVRVIRACRELGIETVAAVSEADRDGLPARLADRAVCVGPSRAAHSHLNQNALLATAIGTGCDAVQCRPLSRRTDEKAPVLALYLPARRRSHGLWRYTDLQPYRRRHGR